MLALVAALCHSPSAVTADIVPHLVQSGFTYSSWDRVRVSQDIVVYERGWHNVMGKVIDHDNPGNQRLLLDATTAQPWNEGAYNFFDVYTRADGTGYVVFSHSYEHQFYRQIDASGNVQPATWLDYDYYHNWELRVHGDNLLWDWAPGAYTHFDVKLEDLTTGTRTTHWGGSGHQQIIDVWGDYALMRSGDTVFYKQLWTSGNPSQILAEDGATLQGWGIQGSHVLLYGNSGLYIYNIGTDAEARRVVDATGHSISGAALDEFQIVWSDDRNGNFDLFGLSLAALDGTLVQITDSPGSDELKPLLDDGLLYWFQGADGVSPGDSVDLYVGALQIIPEPSVGMTAVAFLIAAMVIRCRTGHATRTRPR